MKRYTISIEDDLAEQFEAWAERHGYVNRSEAIRDLLRDRFGEESLEGNPEHDCVAAVSYVYDHEERDLSRRLNEHQHAHHDLSVSTLHVHLDAHLCIEVSVMQGPQRTVMPNASALIAERGVRHGKVHMVPLAKAKSPRHRHPRHAR